MIGVLRRCVRERVLSEEREKVRESERERERERESERERETVAAARASIPHNTCSIYCK
jgi:hypothetical protein